MKSLSLLFKKWRVGRLVMTLIAGFVLLLNTACNTGNVQGARPNNLPVQMGGNNNPHSMGGDGYTDYKMSTDPKVNSARPGAKAAKQASLPGSNLIAIGGVKSNASDMQYGSSRLSDTDTPDIGPVQQKSLPRLPNPKQPMVDRSDPDAKILERVAEAFKDASAFVKDTAESAADRSETKMSPALGQ